MIRTAMAVLTLVLLVQGCASTGAAAAADGSTTRASRSRTDVIAVQELAEHPELATLEEAVRTLRPRWRVETVYINENLYVGASRDIPLHNVRELRYFNVSEAQMRWGQSISTSVIQVITR